MYKSKVLIGFISICYVLFAIFEFSGNDIVAYNLNALIIPLITLTYMLFISKKSIWFFLFLILYSIADLMALVINNMPIDQTGKLYDYQYYIGNSLYIIAYMFLVVKIVKSLSLKHVIKNFKIHLLVLSILNVYLVYVLQIIIHPNLVLESDYYLELVYNIVVVLLLAVALLNYFYRDNKKSLYLFIGSVFIVFSEFIDVAYIYITQRSLLNVIGTTLAMVAFYFYYQQSKLLNQKTEENNYMLLD
ncbi:hypothetical protein MBM09_06460 [Flaviramulus sp. BrNp1-15]|uniref:hypothetical protein n=1 Tax=Flaviramulus sp. BrNp1-15 TaxID=2916754 RepID=UPI001EE7BE7D|nr:hypothetical protein [Flaviramulus sp. BrNp1-15]ULC60630.1 hypothetical protein MBM09_06460 [Flaviramulus sp. BrNp1-15]